jgi:pantoate--beta-alanine ligase
MLVYRQIQALQNQIFRFKSEGKIIGFVPTMGALHQGHLSLVAQAKAQCDVVVVSIYVNPTQFNDPLDLEKYPRNEEGDLNMLQSVGCDLVFVPTDDIMYHHIVGTKIMFPALEQVMEGAHRPGHFQGVALVVSKLFNIVQPHMAFFGQKDLQQFTIIRQMVKDLAFQIQLVRVNTVREKSGLAMSSRNQRLSDQGLIQAAQIYQGLQLVEKLILEFHDISYIKKQIESFFSNFATLHLEYIEIVHELDLTEVTQISANQNYGVCIAANIEGIRLIDNIIIST